jgi:hypothetical protein
MQAPPVVVNTLPGVSGLAFEIWETKAWATNLTGIIGLLLGSGNSTGVTVE